MKGQESRKYINIYIDRETVRERERHRKSEERAYSSTSNNFVNKTPVWNLVSKSKSAHEFVTKSSEKYTSVKKFNFLFCFI